MNPTVREPICFNAAAALSLLPLTVKRTEWAMAEENRAQMSASIESAYDEKELPVPEPGAMSYMMSKQTYFGPLNGKANPHLMFYFPKTDSMVWGVACPDRL